MDHHVHWAARLGTWVLISESRYKLSSRPSRTMSVPSSITAFAKTRWMSKPRTRLAQPPPRDGPSRESWRVTRQLGIRVAAHSGKPQGGQIVAIQGSAYPYAGAPGAPYPGRSYHSLVPDGSADIETPKLSRRLTARPSGSTGRLRRNCQDVPLL
jgi:hypothetical protein